MDSATATGGSLITMLITFMLIGIPIAVLNAAIARRKGRSGAKFGWLSVIPFVGYFLAIYLVSLTDKALMDKIDSIVNRLESTSKAPPMT
jgi:hypothetical protein